MTTPRRQLIDATRPVWAHCTSRCVRRAYLAGDQYEHRKQWIEERLQLLSRCFAIDIAGYAIMSNHVHVILRMQREHVTEWTHSEVARRWLSVYPKKYLSDGTPILPSEAEIAASAQQTDKIILWRKRLKDLGWFMKAFKEPIARRANKEDKCSGAFWEGRYHSVALLDQSALIACLAYIDLNPIRAKITDRPKRSCFTSGYHRIRARNRHRAAATISRADPKRAQAVRTAVGLTEQAKHPEDGLWLTALKDCIVGEPLANKRLSVDEYLTILDATGRLLRDGKRGAIPVKLAPILTRLDLSVDAWLATMRGWRMCAYTSAMAHYTTRQAEATKRGIAWIRNRCPLFAKQVA